MKIRRSYLYAAGAVLLLAVFLIIFLSRGTTIRVDDPDCLYELMFSFSVSSDGNLRYAGSSHTELSGITELASDGNHPCSYTLLSSGELQISLRGIGNSVWLASTDTPDVMTVRILSSDENGIVYLAAPCGIGTADLTFREKGGTGVLTLHCIVDKDGTVTVSDRTRSE